MLWCDKEQIARARLGTQRKSSAGVLNTDSLGRDTSGTWELFLDGDAAGLADTFDEKITALWVNADNSVHLSANHAFTLNRVWTFGKGRIS
jgi:hypothetical protein